MSSPNFGRRFRDEGPDREPEARTNGQIRVPNVRVVRNEEQLGVMPTYEALRLAQDDGLDLVEVAPAARPPVCRIMDYGRHKYEQQLKKKEGAKRQRESQAQLKEIRLRPGIADHDTHTKVGHARRFLGEGCRVQFTLQFRGQRELSHRDQGMAVMTRVVEALAPVAVVEKPPKMEGNRITCLLATKE